MGKLNDPKALPIAERARASINSLLAPSSQPSVRQVVAQPSQASSPPASKDKPLLEIAQPTHLLDSTYLTLAGCFVIMPLLLMVFLRSSFCRQRSTRTRDV